MKVVLTKTIKDLCLSLNPNKIRQGWQHLYQQWQLELSIPIPEVPFDQKRIAAEKKGGRILIFVWETLADREGLLALGQLFPLLNSWATNPGSGVTADPALFGWMFVESSLDAPNRNTTEKQLSDTFAKQNATGYGLPVYIIFGQFRRKVFGSYPDINTWARLLGSSGDGVVLDARFCLYGHLHVNRRLFPVAAIDDIGGRSAAV